VNGEIRRYQLFRDVNTRIATINAEQEARQGQFLCECGQRDCITELTLDLEEFEQVRGSRACSWSLRVTASRASIASSNRGMATTSWRWKATKPGRAKGRNACGRATTD
jgi:hypothetical protein